MHIQFIEIQNFRKLKSVRIDFHRERTLLVGANNSGKTSAMQCLSHFLVDPKLFTTNDFTLSNWDRINAIGQQFTGIAAGPAPANVVDWADVLPSLDIWLHIEDGEIHYVSHILPTLDWRGGAIGIRLRYEPKDIEQLRKEYVQLVADAAATKEKALAKYPKDDLVIDLWPKSMRDFLDRRMKALFQIRAYTLDPEKSVPPTAGVARPQPLPDGSEPLDGMPLEGLIRIDEITAQRGFGAIGTSANDDRGSRMRREQRKLSEQLRSYYTAHLDPTELPEAEDVSALAAISRAERLFDAKLKDGFKTALEEIETLGYPGIADPKLSVGTRLRPADALDHDAAVRYEVSPEDGQISAAPLLLPEECNGLGYQNLISMVFRLMSFRDAWMLVGKAGKRAALSPNQILPPLHLVLIEEPEAHLHAQVQQVFIRKAYAILRRHVDLGDNSDLSTQLVVSTHSSHIAYECKFDELRYFRRLTASPASRVPVSIVVNLSYVFGEDDTTDRFVTRYLTATHSDLLFADAAILIEGSAERLLFPHFIRNRFTELYQRYITLLQLGGSHAHRFRPLIEAIGLTILIVTDIDAVAADSEKSALPARGQGLVTSNTTLKTWHPKKLSIDELFSVEAKDAVIPTDNLLSARVAYQCPIQAAIGDEDAKVELFPRTFEDALIYSNIPLFKALPGHGLIAKIRTAINTLSDAGQLNQEVYELVRGGDKGAFALDLLFSQDPIALNVPKYIHDGLAWLQEQLRRNDQNSDGVLDAENNQKAA